MRRWTKNECQSHWWRTLEKWTQWGNQLVEDVKAIERPELRFTVAALLDVVSSRYGIITYTPNETETSSFRLHSIVLEAECKEALISGMDAYQVEDKDGLIKEACAWFTSWLYEKPGPFVGWLTRSITTKVPEGQPVSYQIVWDRVIYDMQKQKIVGVSNTDSPHHHGHRIYPVES